MKAIAMGVTFALLCGAGYTQVVKCVGENGKITYSDAACSSSAASVNVNVSGGNITEDQVRQSQERRRNESTDNTNEACPALMSRAQQAFSRYQEIRNVNSSDASLRALESLGNYCPGPDTCNLIKRRAQDAQQRYDELQNRNASYALDASLSLLGKYCQGGGRQQSRSGQPPSVTPQPSITNNRKPSGYETKDKFGTIVNSESCHWTKDAHGNDVRSAACSR